MSSLGRTSAPLGEIEPAGSRHLGRRSAVVVTDDRVVAGTANGEIVGFDHELRSQWRESAGDDSIVSIAAFDGCVAVGERGAAGAVRVYDAATGARRWKYETAADVGPPQEATRFLLPFVADLAADDDHLYVAARRYERRNEGRHFESVVLAFEPDGTVAWRYETDASPISLDVRADSLAVAYNRCPGDHQCGLVVLDTDTGSETMTWDPGTDGQRRVGDVSLTGEGIAVASHGDYHGYRLAHDGREQWRVPLATPDPRGGDTVYAYPNHVHATDDGVLFVTGNTYPEEGRKTDARHPNEHTIFGYESDGERRFDADVAGFATGIGTREDVVAVPGAQHFRDRDETAHGLRTFDVDGPRHAVDADGVVTATALGDGLVAAIEEPISYHDRDGVRGEYRVHLADEC